MPEMKQRHGCLTLFLIFLILISALIALNYTLNAYKISRMIPVWAVMANIVIVIMNIVSAVALLQLKKWGFWLFFALGWISTFVNWASGLPFFVSMGGLVSVLILYGILHIGKDNKGWPQLD
ncbi:MAG: hypothetical protein JW774_09660 [Candidatus Aureabacteria bacterium]|nr:hypothetical protein [Candidatus Auribacterota bacterium]